MMRRWLLGIAIAVLAAGSVTFAQDQGRVVKHELTLGWSSAPIGPCGNAVILNAADVVVTFVDRYDQGGTLIQSVINIRTIRPSVYFLAKSVENPERLGDQTATGVPGETQTERLVYAEDRVYIQGSIFQVTVPHYGRIFSETGRTVFDMINGTPLSDTGHNGAFAQDVAALCAYLSQ